MPSVDTVPGPGDRIVHLVGRLTEAVFSFLGPASAALARAGVEQRIVLLDDADHRHLLPNFHESVRLVLTPSHGTRARDMLELRKVFERSIEESPPHIIHVHGVLPLIIAARSAQRRRQRSKLIYSPHGSKALGGAKLGKSLASSLARLLSGRAKPATLANVTTDARRLNAISGQMVDILESPVGPAFFGALPIPARRPLLVTSSRSAQPVTASLFAQCAVLMNGHPAEPSFRWVGSTDQESIARLEAANVEMVDSRTEADRIVQLGSAWAYIALGGPNGFPIHLAEAMSMGLPCIAWDNAYHRDLITNGENGLLCRDMDEVLAAANLLLADRALATQLGAAAQNGARVRFSETLFEHSLLSIYSTNF